MTIYQRLQRTIVILLALLPLRALAYEPTDSIIRAQETFRDNKFGIFIHWGIYSMLGDGEWVMHNKKLNYNEYTHLADGFYPSRFDAEEWVKAFKAAGARYITFTSRHHDGFSMFKTATSNYNIVDGTPYHRDVLKELAAACRKYGLKLHVYYSHLDWHRTDYPLGRTGTALGRPTDRQDYNTYLSFMKQQLTELLTGYGPLGAIWFDGWWDHDSDATPFDWHLDEQYALIHRLQPSCMVANNHHQVPFAGEDIQIFEQDLPGENSHGLSGQGIGQLPLETCLTMNETWGYNITDKDYKSAEFLIRSLVKAAGKNANLLLNIGPRPDGQLPAEAVERLKAIGKWMQQYGTTIYGTRGGIVAPHDWGVTTQRGKTLYVHILKGEDRGLYLPLPRRQVRQAVMFDSRAKVGVIASGDGTTITLPSTPTGIDTIVEVTLR